MYTACALDPVIVIIISNHSDNCYYSSNTDSPNNITLIIVIVSITQHARVAFKAGKAQPWSLPHTNALYQMLAVPIGTPVYEIKRTDADICPRI